MSLAAASAVRAAEEFIPPGPREFDLPPVFSVAGIGITKPMLLLVLAVIVVFAFFYVAIRSRAMVPGRLQYMGEAGYSFVRNSVSRDIIGQHDFSRFTPYLFALFFFILVNNWFGSFPGINFPTFSKASMAYALAGLSWLIYNGVGIARHGFFGYLKLQCVPPNITGPILVLLIPLEFFSNLIVRPITLALRLFANMFAGHLLIILFAVGGQYLLFEGALLLKPVGILAWVLFILIYFLELLVQFLQAYVFVLLNAMYISGAVADEH